jgi:hypothetical protein
VRVYIHRAVDVHTPSFVLLFFILSYSFDELRAQ